MLNPLAAIGLFLPLKVMTKYSILKEGKKDNQIAVKNLGKTLRSKHIGMMNLVRHT